MMESIPSCSFDWKIGNLWYCWFEKGDPLVSPTFDLSLSIPTRWSLILYPRGVTTEDYVGVYLRRENDVRGPNIIKASFQLEILDKNGACLKRVKLSEYDFARGSEEGVEKVATQHELFGTEKEIFFPRNPLTIHCTLWMKDELFVLQKNSFVYASTTFRITRRSFVYIFQGLSAFTSEKVNNFLIMDESRKVLATFNLISGLEGEIILEMMFWDESLKTFSFKVSVIDSEGEKVNFGFHRFFFKDHDRIKRVLILKKQLMENESRFLPNGNLYLACEYAFSNGNIFHIYEGQNFGMNGLTSLAGTKLVKKNEQKLNIAQNQPVQELNLVSDLESMYRDGVLCDIELRTSTQAFPAHKTLLMARSPVFRRMFSSDMREKNSGHVDITDLEDDTVRRMLIYIYTDALEDLQFESASELYTAADKYAILSLKNKCSCFLKDNVTSKNACGLLLLADRHQDEDMKLAAQDYILSHDKEVFGSSEWKDFMATNLQLAADIMYRKVYPS